MALKYRRIYSSTGQCSDFRGLSAEAVLLYLLMIAQADHDGKLLAVPSSLKSSCALFIDDIKEKDINTILGQLSANGLIMVYEWNGMPILMIKNFKEKQEVRKAYETASKFPDPDECNSVELQSIPKYSKVSQSSKVNLDNSDFEECYSAYPRKEGKAQALKHWNAHPRAKEDMLKAISNYEKDLNKRYFDPIERKKFTQTAGRFFFESWEDWIETEEDRKKKAEDERQKRLAKEMEDKKAKFLAEHPEYKKEEDK